MYVYGDVERFERADEVRAELVTGLRALDDLPAGLERHAELVRIFIRTAELVQGLADAEFEARGADANSPLQQAGAQMLLILAKAVGESWTSGFRGSSIEPGVLGLLQALHAPTPIRTKRAEGYALYGLYPENYYLAARRSGLGPETVVIGIRSIGTGLAAMVAAGLGTAPPVTLRPFGDPFDRKVQLAPELASELLEAGDVPFAIVDEGPGLSGSSFGGVADWLEHAGVPRERIHFFTSHSGDLGVEAKPAHRARWQTARRHCLDLEESLVLTSEPAHRLETWVGDLLGPLDKGLVDVSAGTWRKLRYPDEGHWPPAYLQLERRKFLARAQGADWLVKFVGLGNEGPRKLETARRLHRAGYGAEPAGLCHGFLVERWLPGVPLDPARADRAACLARIGSYLGFRAATIPATPGGASLEKLVEMAVYNTELALGAASAATLDRHLAGLPALEGQVVRVGTDNRLHRWEWLAMPGAELVKSDALDHNAAHDLIGCQDIAWDLAGAIIEFDLSEAEAATLAETVSMASGRNVDRELVDLLLPCYLAFQMGLWHFAELSTGEPEKSRSGAASARYRDLLARFIADGCGAERWRATA